MKCFLFNKLAYTTVPFLLLTNAYVQAADTPAITLNLVPTAPGSPTTIPDRLPYNLYKKDTSITIKAECKNPVPGATFDFNEVDRKTRIATDLKTLASALSIAGVSGCDTPGTYTLTKKRSTLKISLIDSSKAVVASKETIVGPPEHFFISLDLPVSNRKTLKYDKDTKKLLPTDEKNQFYAAINYQLGDLLDPAIENLSWDRAIVKLSVQMSSKPLDSFGIGIGYVLPEFDRINLSAFNIFVGHFWTKQDAIVDGDGREDYAYKKAWRAGISFSLDEGLKWVK